MNRHILFYILTGFFLLTQCFPPINLIIPIGGAEKLAIFVIGTMFLFPSLLTKKSIIWMFVYGLLTFFYYLLGNAYFDSIGSVIVPFMAMMSGLLMSEYAIEYDDHYKYSRLVVLIAIVSNIVMALLTIPQIMINPNIVRVSELLMDDTEVFGSTLSYWITGYHTIHGLPCILAPMVFLCKRIFKTNKKQFLISIAPLLILYYLIFKANAVMSFLISTIVVVMSLLFSKHERFNRAIITRVVIVGSLSLILTSPKVLVPLINATQNMMDESGATYKRLNEIKDSIVYGESSGDLAARQDLYGRSQDLFWESPISGTSHPELISRHTWLIDQLACFGILFIIPLVMVFITHIKKMYNSLCHTRVTYVLGVAAYLLMLYLKNSFGIGTWLYAFAVLPILCRYIDFVIDNRQ